MGHEARLLYYFAVVTNQEVKLYVMLSVLDTLCEYSTAYNQLPKRTVTLTAN